MGQWAWERRHPKSINPSRAEKCYDFLDNTCAKKVFAWCAGGAPVGGKTVGPIKGACVGGAGDVCARLGRMGLKSH